MVANDPFDRVLAALREHRAQIRSYSLDRVRATCPAHSDGRASLVVTRREGKVLIRCFAGCRTGAIVQALGLRMADLFGGERTARRRAEIVACYDYCDRQGVIVAQKVRFLPKSFGWRRPDPLARGRCHWGLEGRVPGLYRLPELTGAPYAFLTEGEKAVDLLRSLGLVATCPPVGAGTWSSRWSEDLWSAGCRELVILADHDQAGEQHAERVAADICALKYDEPVAVKVVLLPSLAPGADVVDWLEGGKSLDDLLAVVADTPRWAPGAKDRQRADTRRTKTRERMRRLRAARRAAGGGNGDAAYVRTAAECNAVTLAQTRERVRRHRERLRAAQGRTVTDGAGNAQPVTRDAVTQGERSSVPLQESLSREELPNIHSVTQKSVTEKSVTKEGVAKRRETEGRDTATRDTEAAPLTRCCQHEAWAVRHGEAWSVQCRICPQSPTYGQRAAQNRPATAGVLSEDRG